MTDHYEAPHPLADYCQHAGVGKACRPCREFAVAANKVALESLVEYTEMDMRSSADVHEWVDVESIRAVNEYVSNYIDKVI